MSFMNCLKSYSDKMTGLFVHQRMRSTRVILALVIFLALFTKPAFANNTFWVIFSAWVGYFLIIFACLGRVFSAAFICGTKNEKLSMQGPFSIVRNPLYVFSFIGTLGFGLLSGHIIIFIILLGTFFLYYPDIVNSEENFLLGQFGEQYQAYQREVPRWFPREWKMDIPETITVYPALLLKTIRDSSLFFLIFPIVESIELMHRTGFLPTLFSLY
jgi:protein-S-isoprenylcysteine O-methyltransferase Ste14